MFAKIEVQLQERMLDQPEVVEKILEMLRAHIQFVDEHVPKQEVVRHVSRVEVYVKERIIEHPEIHVVQKIFEVPQVQF